jgi:hypothetical protein
MDQASLDLLSLLDSYASRHNSSIVTINLFVRYVEAAVREGADTVPGLSSFSENTGERIYKTLDDLIGAGEVLQSGGGTGKVCVVSFLYQKINAAYDFADPSVETPFPNISSFILDSRHENYLKHIYVADDFLQYLNSLDENSRMEVFQLVFGGEYGSITVSTAILPERVLEIALLKVRDYLHRYGKSGFFQEKLTNLFPREKQGIAEYLKSILVLSENKEKVVSPVISGSKFAYSFWSFFYNLVNMEMDHQKGFDGAMRTGSIVLYQASAIIMVLATYYHSAAQENRSRELGFSALEKEMDQPPYYYTLDEIRQFQSVQKQKSEQNDYEQEMIEYIKTKLKPEDDQKMPSILSFRNRQEETWYVKKSRILNLCTKLIEEAPPILKKCIEDRWSVMVKNYQTENTMFDNSAFESLLGSFAKSAIPHFLPIIRAPKLEVVIEELTESGAQFQFELFNNGEPVALYKLFDFRQKALLSSIYAGLPFWYKNKFIVKLVGFIKHGKSRDLVFLSKGKKNMQNKQEQQKKARLSQDKIDTLAQNLISDGNTIEGELDILAEKWNQLLDKTAQKKLRKDVDIIINSAVAYQMKTRKFDTLSVPIIQETAESIVSSNVVLKKMRSESLRKYIMLYTLKLMKAKNSPRNSAHP